MPSDSTVRRISPADLVSVWGVGDELALLDAREQGAFSQEHLFWACCLPLSRLELSIGDAVPRRSTPVVWCDWDGAPGGLAERAARRLTELGWIDVAILDGGTVAWKSAGNEVYSGVNVPSKAFGEFVEHAYETPHVAALELAARVAAGEDIVILDSRPMDEYRRMSIPGGIDCPGAELAYRVHDAAPNPTTTVVVNCAGRTRSIIGAQSLRNAGVPNPVLALENGTMGWELAGLELAHGHTEHAADPSPEGLARAQGGVDEVAKRFGVEGVDRSTLRGWLVEADRTTVVFDVRSPAEFEAGHVAGSRNAPGGQLVQATDEYVATWHARVVLVDDTGVRATMTASWLNQLGMHEVYVLEAGLGDGPLEIGSVQPSRPGPTPDVLVVEPADVDGRTVIDLAPSATFRRGHVPGAWWAVRARLDEAAARLPDADDIVLTSPDGVLAALAVPDGEAAWPGARIGVLRRGTAAWQADGRALEAGDDRLTTTADDAWYKPYEAPTAEAVRQHMEDYLTWEIALLEQIERDPLVRFERF